MTDQYGQFRLVGLFESTTTFHATKEGHVGATQTFFCNTAACEVPSLRFYLQVLAPPADIAGQYSLTFVADSACADLLPEAVRTRTYEATIAPTNQANTEFKVTVGGASLLERYQSFEVGVAGDYLGFNLHGGHDPVLVEQVTEDRLLAFSGYARASVGAAAISTISAPFEGWIEYCPSSYISPGYSCISRQPPTYAKCESDNHRLILTRP